MTAVNVFSVGYKTTTVWYCSLSAAVHYFSMLIKTASRLVGFTVLALGMPARGSPSLGPRADAAAQACQLLQASFPQLVSFPGSEQYETDIDHWAFTSSQNATCAVEPANADDVGAILKIIGRDSIRAPFAVKAGGHALNKGFSSTPGVQISMAKFTGLLVDAVNSTVTVGAALTWGQVYSQLEPFGVMLTGGRNGEVGVTGLSLGGGYSWKTNQFGLTIDTIVSYNLVLPSGQQVLVTNTTYPDLFFGLKGGLNNFGIVTDITFESHPQGLVFAGEIEYGLNVTDRVNAAIGNFSLNNTDPKAQLVVTYTYVAGQFQTVVVPFYDGPNAPTGIFDEFFAIPSVQSNITTRSFVDFVNLISGDLGLDIGLAATAVPITTYPQSLLDKIVNETITTGDKLTAATNSTVVVIMVPEPFLNPFSHSRGGAYPHPPSRQVTPSSPEIAYPINSNLTADEQEAFYNLIVSAEKEYAHNIQAAAVAEGVSKWDDILYPNYAIADTPLELLYGDNVERLRQIATKYDPQGVMKLTGGFHF
ncbi:FAD-binding domain-containing protein [Fomitiporia mediterranea MF3/22]|uniref:FAD-binding domain-containing protein n=1 Tax=Fomitiporia mediterranea (strain MF3/22) TaxID=694068 RepID=UPI00044094B5|nr:FAD-binding domain-containing protein [Fomitiporia mediterranea MF3/22]EJD05648.1 FAD-binding domain-containing protein [Fomitiporia mediterranea MF3/22]